MIFKRPIFWALWILGSACFSVMRMMPQLTDLAASQQPAAPAISTVATAMGPKPGQNPSGPRQVTVAPDSHGHHTVFAEAGGLRVRFLVDSGASIVTLTANDALNLGFKPRPDEFNVAFNTANGRVYGARILLPKLSIGDILVERVEAVVLPREALSVSLLGQSFLKRLKGYEVSQGRLILKG
jgi:aspartyl protease family protein